MNNIQEARLNLISSVDEISFITDTYGQNSREYKLALNKFAQKWLELKRFSSHQR